MYSTVTGIDFNSPHSHANGFPAQHTGLPSCFCPGRRFSCMQLKKENHFPPTRAFGFGMPNQHGVCPSSTSHPAPAESPLPGFDGTPRVSRPKYSFWLSPSRNGCDIGSPAEASPFLGALPRMSGIGGCVCVPTVDSISHGLHSTDNAVRSAADWRLGGIAGAGCAFHNRRPASASSRNRNDDPPGPPHLRPESHRLPAVQKGPCLGPACVPASRLTGSSIHVSVGRLRTVCAGTARRCCAGVIRQTARHLPPGARDIVLSQVSMASLWHNCGITVA